MLISPFRKDKWFAGIQFAALAAVFLSFYFLFGVLIAGDSNSYLSASVRVSPFYPTLISGFRLLFGDAFYLNALILFQELLAAYAICSLSQYLGQRLALPRGITVIVSLVFLTGYVLRCVAVNKEALYCNTVLTEGIAYPLYFLFMKYFFASILDKKFSYVFTMLLLCTVLSCTRGQLIWTVVIVAVAFFYVLCANRRNATLQRKTIFCKAGAALAGYFVILALFPSVFHYLNTGSFTATTMGNEAVLGAVLYNSDAEDTALLSDYPEAQQLLSDALRISEEKERTYRFADGNLIARFKHFENQLDDIKYEVFQYSNPALQSGEMDFEDAQVYAATVLKPALPILLRDNFSQYIKNCGLNFIAGIVRGNSGFNQWGVLFSAALYLAAMFFCLPAIRRRSQMSRLAADVLCCVLLCMLLNALFCCFGIFALSRYMFYNFPCFYMALGLCAFAFLRSLFAAQKAKGTNSAAASADGSTADAPSLT